MPIDHVAVLDSDLVERYLLRELSDADSEDFELHFFECAECAEAVGTGELLMANGRSVALETATARAVRESPTRQAALWSSFFAWWTRPSMWLPVAASLVFGGLALYQTTVVIPALRDSRYTPRVLPAFQLVGASRGDTMQIALPPDAPFFSLAADIPPDANFARYSCELSVQGRTVSHVDASAPAAGQPITILIPAAGLRAGPYRLEIFGARPGAEPGEKVSSFSFDLRILK